MASTISITDVESVQQVTLSDSAGTYGIRRKSDGVPVVPAGTEVDNPSAGTYSFEVTELADDVAYEVSWKVEHDDGSPDEYVTATINKETATDYADTLIMNYLAERLGEFTRLQVWNETYTDADVRIESDGARVRLEYNPLNTVYSPTVVKVNEAGEARLVEGAGNDFTVDYLNGVVRLNTPLAEGEDVSVTYRFNYFTKERWRRYIQLALDELNALTRQAFAIDDAPQEWDPMIVLNVYIRSLEDILTESGIWRNALIWRDPDQFRSAVQGSLAANQARYTELTANRYIKRRGRVRPRAVTSIRYTTPLLIDNVNFRAFTILASV